MRKSEKFLFEELANILKIKVKPNHRNFLYLASGVCPERNPTYQELPYDNIFLVDKSYPYSHLISDRIFCIKADATKAVEVFRQAGVKMDFYTSIQEGLNEGGAEYPLNTNAWYGFVLPILKNRYIHLLHSNYEQRIQRLPFENRTKIDSGHTSYINPELITSNPDGAEFWILEDRSNKRHEIKVQNITLKILHKSIWEDFDELDLVFSRMDETMKSKLNNPEKIIDFDTHWRDNEAYIAQCNNLLAVCNDRKAAAIGMIPFGWDDYNGFLSWLKTAEFKYTREIRLYHLAKNDFQSLYSII